MNLVHYYSNLFFFKLACLVSKITWKTLEKPGNRPQKRLEKTWKSASTALEKPGMDTLLACGHPVLILIHTDLPY